MAMNTTESRPIFDNFTVMENNTAGYHSNVMSTYPTNLVFYWDNETTSMKNITNMTVNATGSPVNETIGVEVLIPSG
jgi:hypothetical protein